MSVVGENHFGVVIGTSRKDFDSRRGPAPVGPHCGAAVDTTRAPALAERGRAPPPEAPAADSDDLLTAKLAIFASGRVDLRVKLH